MRARRLEILDEYVEDDEAVVFVDGQVVALSALATTALLSVGTAWTEAAVVAAALVAKFQDPPPGTDPLAATHDLTLFISLVREPPVPECVEDGLLVVGDRRAESLLGAVDRDGR
mgnify:CR=1 FL=1